MTQDKTGEDNTDTPGEPITRARRFLCEKLSLQLDLGAETLADVEASTTDEGLLLRRLMDQANAGAVVSNTAASVGMPFSWRRLHHVAMTIIGTVARLSDPAMDVEYLGTGGTDILDLCYAIGGQERIVQVSGRLIVTRELVAKFVDDINSALEQSGCERRLVGYEVGSPRTIRLMSLPADRVHPLAARDALDYGSTAGVEAHRPFEPVEVHTGRRPTPEDLVASEHILVTDGESVDAASDYLRLVEDLIALTGGDIQLDQVDCTEEQDKRRLQVCVSSPERPTLFGLPLPRAFGKRYVFADLEGRTDWIDDSNLVDALNTAAERVDAPARFYLLDDIRWGQEVGFVYANADECDRLAQNNFLRLR